MQSSPREQCDETGIRVLKILIVDDHPGVRESIVSLIAVEFPGHPLLEADNAEDALTLFESDPPWLVVLDLTLPGMNGFEATRRIKQLSPHTQVVMHTSSDLPIYRNASIDAGCSAFVGKGRDSKNLVPVISRLLAGRSPEFPTT